MNKILVFSLLYFLLINPLLADSKIIKDGLILQTKSYSSSEATLVVNNADKIYVCSISGELTKCILSNNKHSIN